MEEKMMNVDKKVQRCYGCGACANSCPFGAISMQEDENGFLRPVIDKNECKDCGKCMEVCPSLVNQYQNSNQPECYAAWAEDEIRMKCASGGIYTAIAKEIIRQGGWVAGAVWKEDFRVEHILTNQEEELAFISSSKYVQSNTLKVYSEIKIKLEAGEVVLFSGCPCQVAGLYSFLQKDYSTLYTIDLICHGVPSHKVLKKYLQDEYNYEDIEKVDFRDKSVFGWSTEMNIYFKESEQIHKRSGQDSFYKAFLKNLSLNRNCEICQFSKVPRQGDISLGDFWNIEKFDPGLTDGKGTSLVLINNDRGKKLFKENTYIIKKECVPLEFVRQTCNKTVFEPFRHHFGRDRFFREFERKPFRNSVEECLAFHYDIGLVTTWFARNFGAIFTAYALYKKLEEMGYSVLMLNKPKELWTEQYFAPGRNTIAIDFGKRYYNISKQYAVNGEPNLSLLNNSCDTFMLGSDQLWNPKIYAYLFYYFLDFVDGRRKISYATSIGADHFEGTESDRHKISYLLSRFDSVSVRENEAVKVCEEAFNICANQVCDPVFLLDPKCYETLANSVGKKMEGNFIFAYILDGNLEKKKLIEAVAQKFGMPVLCAYDIEHPENSKRYLQLEEADIRKPEDWLWYIKHSSYIITDSYHGACFSTIFHKKFICLANSLRGTGRFIELFEKLGMDNHLILDIENINVEEIIRNIDSFDYDTVEHLLGKERERSEKWLNESLTNRNKGMTVEDYILEQTSAKFNSVDQRLTLLQAKADSIQMYNHISQIGLLEPCSVQQIIECLPNNSYFQQVQGDLGFPITDTPVPYGVLTIKKTTNYFIEVQFVQMTYKTKRPQLYIANVINGKVEGWERFASASEYEEMMKKANALHAENMEKIKELEKDINFLIRKYARKLED